MSNFIYIIGGIKMKWLINGGVHTASYLNIENILDKYISHNDFIMLPNNYGINGQIEDYCIKKHISYKMYNLNDDTLPYTRLLINLSDKCLFIFSIVEPPSLNYAYMMALNIKDLDSIVCDFA